MECSALHSDFPFVARRYELLDQRLGLDSSLKSDLMFMDWFLKLSRMGKKVRLCPDILYVTHEVAGGKYLTTRKIKYNEIMNCYTFGETDRTVHNVMLNACIQIWKEKIGKS